jgi:hypothetical protein
MGRPGHVVESKELGAIRRDIRSWRAGHQAGKQDHPERRHGIPFKARVVRERHDEHRERVAAVA